MKARRALIEKFCKPSGLSILEIGALDSPTYDGQSHRVKFVDYASREVLAEKGERNPRYRYENLVPVDYVCATLNYTEVISEKFDLIIANHVVEHIPDIIHWLDQLHKVLTPGGMLFLAVPDKRYTFDIVRNTTTFIDLLRNHEEEIRKPTKYQILDHLYHHKQIKAGQVWEQQDLTEVLAKRRFSPAVAIDQAEKFSQLPYADVHCNVFTSASFRETFAILSELKYIAFKVVEVTEVAKNKNEFHVLLQANF